MDKLPNWSLSTTQTETISDDRRHQHRKRKARLTQLGRVVLLVCIIIQTVSLIPGLYRRVSRVDDGRSATKNPFHTAQNPADKWEDNIWPIRQPTPWDISTDFPYPRKLEFDVEEGTWLRLDVHPKSGEIVFDMLGDIYCLPSSAYQTLSRSSTTRARPILSGVPHDSDPHFSPDGKLLAFRSDAELGVENIWVTEWKGCDNMDIRPKATSPDARSEALLEALELKDVEDEMLAKGVKETRVKKQRRLRREGRLFGMCNSLSITKSNCTADIDELRCVAQRVTNETYRWVSDPRFHPSGTKIIATKWYFSQRSLGAGEGWEYDLPNVKETQIGIGSGKRLVGRSLPFGWDVEEYGEQQIGPEQFVWAGEDSLIYSKNMQDVDGTFQYSKDVHSGIYAIFQQNLTTGATTTLVSSSPGGASRPELSRDKSTLAFVRRVRDKEVLVLKLVIYLPIFCWFILTDLLEISVPEHCTTSGMA